MNVQVLNKFEELSLCTLLASKGLHHRSRKHTIVITAT